MFFSTTGRSAMKLTAKPEKSLVVNCAFVQRVCSCQGCKVEHKLALDMPLFSMSLSIDVQATSMNFFVI